MEGFPSLGCGRWSAARSSFVLVLVLVFRLGISVGVAAPGEVLSSFRLDLDPSIRVVKDVLFSRSDGLGDLIVWVEKGSNNEAEIRALDPSDGSVRWRYAVSVEPAPLRVSEIRFAFGELLVRGTQSDQPKAFLLDLQSGELLFDYEGPGIAEAERIVFHRQADVLLVLQAEVEGVWVLSGYDRSGNRLWERSVPRVADSEWGERGFRLIEGAAQSVYLVDRLKLTAPDSQFFRPQPDYTNTITCHSAADGTVLWSRPFRGRLDSHVAANFDGTPSDRLSVEMGDQLLTLDGFNGNTMSELVGAFTVYSSRYDRSGQFLLSEGGWAPSLRTQSSNTLMPLPRFTTDPFVPTLHNPHTEGVLVFEDTGITNVSYSGVREWHWPDEQGLIAETRLDRHWREIDSKGVLHVVRSLPDELSYLAVDTGPNTTEFPTAPKTEERLIVHEERGVAGELRQTISVAVTGELPLQYQWLRDHQPIPGANSPSLAIDTQSLTRRHDYYVRVSNAHGFAQTLFHRVGPGARVIRHNTDNVFTTVIPMKGFYEAGETVTIRTEIENLESFVGYRVFVGSEVMETSETSWSLTVGRDDVHIYPVDTVAAGESFWQWEPNTNPPDLLGTVSSDGNTFFGTALQRSESQTAGRIAEFSAYDILTGHRRWARPIHPAVSEPSVVGDNGSVFFFDFEVNREGDPPAAEFTVNAVSTQSGELRWKVPIGTQSAPLAYHNGFLFVGASADDGSATVIRKLSAEDGSVVATTSGLGYSVGESLAIDLWGTLVTTDGTGDRVLGLSTDDLSELWVSSEAPTTLMSLEAFPPYEGGYFRVGRDLALLYRRADDRFVEFPIRDEVIVGKNNRLALSEEWYDPDLGAVLWDTPNFFASRSLIGPGDDTLITVGPGPTIVGRDYGSGETLWELAPPFPRMDRRVQFLNEDTLLLRGFEGELAVVALPQVEHAATLAPWPSRHQNRANTRSYLAEADFEVLYAPKPRHGLTGSRVAFEVTVVSREPVTYQWSHNGMPIDGARSRSFVFDSLAATDRGVYSVSVTTPTHRFESTPVALTVYQPLDFSTNYGTVEVEPPPELIDGRTAVVSGTEVNVRAIPDVDRVWLGWDGDLAGQGSLATLVVDRAIVSEARYSPLPGELLYVVAADSEAFPQQYDSPSTFTHVVASPEGIVIATTNHGELVALEAGSGRILWKSSSIGSIRTRPVADLAGGVTVVTSEGQVERFRVADGEPLWSVSVAPSSFGLALSKLGFLVVPSSNRELIAFDIHSGTPVWTKSFSEHALTSSPAFAGDGTLYVSVESGLVGLNPMTGETVETWDGVPNLRLITMDGYLYSGRDAWGLKTGRQSPRPYAIHHPHRFSESRPPLILDTEIISTSDAITGTDRLDPEDRWRFWTRWPLTFVGPITFLNSGYVLGLYSDGQLRAIQPRLNSSLPEGVWSTIDATPQNTRSLERIGPAQVTRHPVALEAVVGETVEFSAYASGSFPVSYQWLKDGAPVLNEVNSFLRIEDVQPSHIGEYSVVVTNGEGSDTSDMALLDVGYRLELSAIPGGVIQAEPSQSLYLPGTHIELQAESDDGRGIVGWHNVTTAMGASASLTIRSNTVVVAEFESSPGEILWSTGERVRATEIVSAGSKAAMIRDEPEGSVRVLDLENGTVVWERADLATGRLFIHKEWLVGTLDGAVTVSELGTGQAVSRIDGLGLTQAAMVTHEGVLITPAGTPGQMLGLQLPGGEELWRQADDFFSSVEALFIGKGGMAFFELSGNRIGCLDPRDGALVWTRQMETAIRHVRPLNDGNLLVIGREDLSVVNAITGELLSSKVEIDWYSSFYVPGLVTADDHVILYRNLGPRGVPPAGLAKIDVWTGETRWFRERDSIGENGAALDVSDRLFVRGPSRSNPETELKLVDLETGELLQDWKLPIRGWLGFGSDLLTTELPLLLYRAPTVYAIRTDPVSTPSIHPWPSHKGHPDGARRYPHRPEFVRLAPTPDVEIPVNEPVTLESNINGSAVSTFQWYQDGEPRLDQTSFALHLDSPQPSDSGVYHLEATSAFGSIQSDPFSVSVGYRIETKAEGGGGIISLSPERKFYPPGESVVVTAGPAEGSEFLSWRGLPDGAEANGNRVEILVSDRHLELVARFRPRPGHLRWTYEGGANLVDPALGPEGTIIIGDREGRINAISPEGELIWETSLSGQVAELVVDADGVIYAVMGRPSSVVAIDARSGATLWSVDVQGSELRWAALGAFRHLYVAPSSGFRVVAVDLVERRIAWEATEPGGQVNALAVGFGGIVYARGRSTRNGELSESVDGIIALRPADGTELWRNENLGATRGGPYLEADGSVVILGSGASHLHRLNGASGEVIERIPLSVGSFAAVALSGENTFALGADRWIGELDWETGAEVVGLTRESGTITRLAVGANRRFYGATVLGDVFAYDPFENEELWSLNTAALRPNALVISPVGYLYMLDSEGVLFSIETESEGGLAGSTWPKRNGDNQNTGRVYFPGPPDVRSKFQSRNLALDDPLSLGVSVAGSVPFEYQWFQDGVLLAGETDPRLSVSAAQSVHIGNYEVEISNALGRVRVPVANVHVGVRLGLQTVGSGTVEIVPERETYDIGSEVTLRAVSKSESERFQYWLDDAGNEIPGAEWKGTLRENLNLSAVFESLPGSVKWFAKTRGFIEGLPALWKSNVLVNSDGVHAFDSRNGRLRWSWETDVRSMNSPVVTADGTCLFALGDGNIVAIDVESGEVQWLNRDLRRFGLNVLAVAPGGILVGGSRSSPVIGVSVATGERLWTRTDLRTFNESSIAVLSDHAVAVPVLSDEGSGVMALDVRDGQTLWWAETGTDVGGYAAVDDSGGSYFSSRLFDPDMTTLLALDSGTGEERWRYANPNEIISTIVITEKGNLLVDRAELEPGNLRFLSSGLTLLSPETGEELWSYASELSVVSSPTLGSGGIAYTTELPRTVLGLSLETGEPVFRADTSAAGSAPVLMRQTHTLGPDGTLFLVSNRLEGFENRGNLIAIQTPSHEGLLPSPWPKALGDQGNTSSIPAPELRIVRIRIQEAEFELEFSGGPGRFVVETSSDLVKWEVFETVETDLVLTRVMGGWESEEGSAQFFRVRSVE